MTNSYFNSPRDRESRKIYLKQEEIKLGWDSTARTTTVENYYQVVEMGEDHIEIQFSDFNDKPIGKASVITKEDHEDYTWCLDSFHSTDTT